MAAVDAEVEGIGKVFASIEVSDGQAGKFISQN
jgi:hypothetical protein